MSRGKSFVWLALVSWLLLPYPSPAPLIYTPGEGWRYEKVGGEGKWQRSRAKDQLEVAQTAFDNKKYSLATRAANRTVKEWPFSDYAPQAQYLLARCEEMTGDEERAFKAYQKLLERYPKITNFEEVVKRQKEIADQYLAGKWFRLWGFIPLYSSMDKTTKLYDQIIQNGPYSPVAPQAQINIGIAQENRWIKDYPAAARAYERAADRYSDTSLAGEALFRAGDAYSKQSKTAEYDQSISAQAIATYTDFMTLFPEDGRVPTAQKVIGDLRAEQARGSFEIAQFYEKRHRWTGALVYYNEVLLKDSESKLADEARKRIAALKARLGL